MQIYKHVSNQSTETRYISVNLMSFIDSLVKSLGLFVESRINIQVNHEKKNRENVTSLLH